MALWMGYIRKQNTIQRGTYSNFKLQVNEMMLPHFDDHLLYFGTMGNLEILEAALQKQQEVLEFAALDDMNGLE